MEFGIFNSLYLHHSMLEADPVHAEHNRLMDEVAWTRAADRAGFKYTWATEHHFLQEYSHLSAQRVVPRLHRRSDRAHPPRHRHQEHHAPGQPPGSRRRAGRDARPPLGRPLRARDGPRLLQHRAVRLRHR